MRLFFVTFLLKSQNCAFVKVRVYLSSVTYFIKDQAYFIAIDSS